MHVHGERVKGWALTCAWTGWRVGHIGHACTWREGEGLGTHMRMERGERVGHVSGRGGGPQGRCRKGNMRLRERCAGCGMLHCWLHSLHICVLEGSCEGLDKPLLAGAG
jgi:hypothetical protein